MRKQLSYSDDLSLLGQRVCPHQPRTTTSTVGERYRLYSPTSAEDHHQQTPARADITYTSSRSVSKTVTTCKPSTQVKPTYAVKINNLDSVIVPVASGQLTRIAEAQSVHELRRLLVACTSSTSSSAAARISKPPSGSTLSTARTAGIRVYERCFLHHCTTLRDALAVQHETERKVLREALYAGIFDRHRRTIFALGSFLRMLRTKRGNYNVIRHENEDTD
ncbi:uncharacterized protein CBL_12884 [Carabus blaptoides fortunei]